MNKIKHTIILIFCLIFLSSCDNFEKNFYKKIDEAKKEAIENGFAYFDLSTVTDFEWDSVFFFISDESMGAMKEEIDEILNNRKSHISWEKRRIKGEVDTLFRWHTKDIPAGRDRFYFLTSDKKLIEKDIDHSKFSFRCCNKQDSLRWYGSYFWLSKQETNFSVIRIEHKFENDTIARVWAIFKTNCIDENKSN